MGVKYALLLQQTTGLEMSIEINQTDCTEESPLTDLEDNAAFIRRHIGPDDEQVSQMLSELGV